MTPTIPELFLELKIQDSFSIYFQEGLLFENR